MEDRYSILVVDDEEVICDLFRRFLAVKGAYDVFTADNGIRALEVVRDNRIDCCFTDLSMPGMDGIELAAKIQDFDNTIPVVVMTGYPTMETAIRTLKSGVVDFLTKPFRMEQIPIVIERVMRNRSLLMDNMLLKEAHKKNEQLMTVNQELREKTKEVETINLILQRLNDAGNSSNLFDVLVNLSGQITPCEQAHLCVVSKDDGDHAVITSFFRHSEKKVLSVKNEIIQKVVKDGLPYLIHEQNGGGSSVAVPLKIRSTVFGILTAMSNGSGYRFNEKDLYFLNFLAEKASSSIENIALYENIYENLFSTLYAFVGTIEARDPYTKQHSTRVNQLAISMAKAMKMSQEDINVLNVAGYLHDIGKIGIPDGILLKPGRLNAEEYEYIKKHPVIGGNIIGHFNLWENERLAITHHHERWDGKGYPDGLEKEDIPLLSRILSVADVYDALASDRSYRKKLSEDVVLGMIWKNSGTQFDPDIVDVFMSLHDETRI